MRGYTNASRPRLDRGPLGSVGANAFAFGGYGVAGVAAGITIAWSQ